MRSPTDASPTSSRTPAHGSGATWIATPSSQWTFTTYSLPVSRRTHFRSGLHPPCLRFAVAVAGHHARLCTRLLVRLCRGRHHRRLNSMRLQGATLTDPDLILSHHPARATVRRLPPSVACQVPPVAG